MIHTVPSATNHTPCNGQIQSVLIVHESEAFEWEMQDHLTEDDRYEAEGIDFDSNNTNTHREFNDDMHWVYEHEGLKYRMKSTSPISLNMNPNTAGMGMGMGCLFWILHPVSRFGNYVM